MILLPHIACLGWKGLQMNCCSSKIDAGFLFAAVSDTQEIPLANQISCCLSWNFMSDNSFRSNMLQNLQYKRHKYQILWTWNYILLCYNDWSNNVSLHLLLQKIIMHLHVVLSNHEICIGYSFIVDEISKYKLQPYELLKDQKLTLICLMLGFHWCISSTLANRRS